MQHGKVCSPQSEWSLPQAVQVEDVTGQRVTQSISTWFAHHLGPMLTDDRTIF